MSRMRFDKDYIYPDDKGNLHSPRDEGTRRVFSPYEVELLLGLERSIKFLWKIPQEDLVLFLELAKDDFICYRTAKRLGEKRLKLARLLQRMLDCAQSNR